MLLPDSTPANQKGKTLSILPIDGASQPSSTITETEAIREVLIDTIIDAVKDSLSFEMSDDEVLKLLLYVSNIKALDKSVFELLNEAQKLVGKPRTQLRHEAPTNPVNIGRGNNLSPLRRNDNRHGQSIG